jgi:Rps23 Pro-64 3,4-dihydroxylase Tpa1-like proline 4-hydroxylase
MELARHLSRTVPIGAHTLHVLDGLFSERDIAAVYALLQGLPYQLADYDDETTAHVRHWKAEIDPERAMKMPVLRDCADAARELAQPLVPTLDRVHANLHLYGDMQFPHVDLAGGLTAIYYANRTWDEAWLGETVFYDDRREPVHVVAPKPGRLAVFPGDVLHRAGVPSRACYEPRLSVALKFTAPR